jgi:hypothetical protein
VRTGVRQAHDTAEALVDGVRSLPMADNVRDALTQAIVYARNSLKLKVSNLASRRVWVTVCIEFGVCGVRGARSAGDVRTSEAIHTCTY